MERALSRSYAMLAGFILVCIALGLATLGIAIEYRTVPVANAYPFFGLALLVSGGLVYLRWESVRQMPAVEAAMVMVSLLLTALIWWSMAKHPDMSAEKVRALYAGRYLAALLSAATLALYVVDTTMWQFLALLAIIGVAAALYFYRTFEFIAED